MNRQKEIILIISIIVLSIFLAFLPKMCSSKNTSEEETINIDNQIKITIKGELKIDSLELELPKGVSYGYIISKIELYLNDYSIVNTNFNLRYYENTTIEIESSDNQNDKTDDNIGKININKASFNELIGLYGIGEKRANKIIEYRMNKQIETFDELKKIIGVSNEIIEAIKKCAFL